MSKSALHDNDIVKAVVVVSSESYKPTPKSNTHIIHDHDDRSTSKGRKKKKRSLGFISDILKVALYLLRFGRTSKGNKVTKSSFPTTANSIKKLVGSVRPLDHLYISQDHNYSPPGPADHVHQLPPPHGGAPPASLPPPTSEGHWEPGMMSAVSSASWLVGEDGNPTEITYGTLSSTSNISVQYRDEDDDHDMYYDGVQGKGDEMIDAKAEEFIAQFYQQMRNQNQAATSDA